MEKFGLLLGRTLDFIRMILDVIRITLNVTRKMELN